MNLDGIRVNHAALEQAAADMTRTVKDIDDRLNRLESELAPLKSDWSGSAQQSYQAAKAKWDQAISEMRDLLTETHQSVSQSNDDYRAADARGAAHFQ
ncbi:WXG100 family type VII secretion target [Nocardioides sp.]|uniref:WXG100 family type VII secretion target n=1 Tax=Nocardioides sp. TaxID=35761 RepID=UPI003517BB9F